MSSVAVLNMASTASLKEVFICPKDGSALVRDNDNLKCEHASHAFPIVRGIPVLIDDDQSVFSISEIVNSQSSNSPSYWKVGTGFRARYRKAVGRIQNQTVHINEFGVREAIAHTLKDRPDARILVLGASNNGFGDANIIYSDVRFGKNVSVLLDAHSIPYPDEYFDCVIAVAILEHVMDPWQCAREITRVISQAGYVYSSIPFLQPVHMGAYDFTRFTYLGHRRLFNRFQEISGGAEMGPSTSTAFAMQHILLCLSDRPFIRKIMRLVGIFAAAALKPIDLIFRHRLGTLDGAASTYFFGQKMERAITDRELLKMYRGAQ
jgi:uncharacterized protein YbaR (Trm112 family)